MANENKLAGIMYEILASLPASGYFEGHMVYSLATHKLSIWTGAAWREIQFV